MTKEEEILQNRKIDLLEKVRFDLKWLLAFLIINTIVTYLK